MGLNIFFPVTETMGLSFLPLQAHLGAFALLAGAASLSSSWFAWREFRLSRTLDHPLFGCMIVSNGFWGFYKVQISKYLVYALVLTARVWGISFKPLLSPVCNDKEYTGCIHFDFPFLN